MYERAPTPYCDKLQGLVASGALYITHIFSIPRTGSTLFTKVLAHARPTECDRIADYRAIARETGIPTAVVPYDTLVSQRSGLFLQHLLGRQLVGLWAAARSSDVVESASFGLRRGLDD